MKIQHLLISRFNLRLWTPERKENARPTDDAWVQRRVELLYRYCAPTMNAQTEQGFDWLVLVDPGTPGWVRSELRAASPRIELVEVVGRDLLERLRHEVSHRLRADTDVLLQTRLDADDGLARTHFEELRDRVVPGRTEYLEAPHGFQLDVATGRTFVRKGWRSNGFTSLAQPASTFPRTIYDGRHRHLDRIAPVRAWTDRPMWLHVIHDVNNSSRINDGRPIAPARVRRMFSIDEDLVAPRRPSQSVRDTVRWGVAGTKRTLSRQRLLEVAPERLGRIATRASGPRRIAAALPDRLVVDDQAAERLLAAMGPGRRLPSEAFLVYLAQECRTGPTLTIGSGVAALLLARSSPKDSAVLEPNVHARDETRALLERLGEHEYARTRVVGTLDEALSIGGPARSPDLLVATSPQCYSDASRPYRTAIEMMLGEHPPRTVMFDDAHEAARVGLWTTDIGSCSINVRPARSKPFVVVTTTSA